MKITTRLILCFLAVSILPLAAVSYAAVQAMERVCSLAVGESTDALRRLGEDSIGQTAQSVARQVDLYLEAHPDLLDLPREELEADEGLAAIAVQPVGETGYTAVHDSDGVNHFHANAAVVGMDLHELADALPAFWDILEAGLDGTPVDGYYDWQEADGSIREKYMSTVPVGDTGLRVAATTYIDEFYQPIRETEGRITQISQQVQWNLLLGLVIVGFLAVGLAVRLAWGISRPVRRLTQAAVALEQGDYRTESLGAETSRRDDLGQLARVFDRMAKEVQAREASLQRQVRELRIQIDEGKRARQVTEITETEYFRLLQEQARRLRGESGPPATEE